SVSIHRGRQTELLTVVARRQDDLAVGDDAPEAVHSERGRTELERTVPRVVLEYAGTSRPVQRLKTHAILVVERPGAAGLAPGGCPLVQAPPGHSVPHRRQLR